MRILFLVHSFNNLTQRLYVELVARGHEISVEFDIRDEVATEAVALFEPDLILATYLRRAIPEEIWQRHLCLVVHPGPVGDRGASALDWATLEERATWGVTVLQANAVMDGGPVWASAEFPMRNSTKSSLYRNEVTKQATACVLEALEKFESGSFSPEPQQSGCFRLPAKQRDRRIFWQKDDTQSVLRKIRSADGFPGVLDEVLGQEVYLFDAHKEGTLKGTAGDVIAWRRGAVCIATTDGALWIGHMKARDGGCDKRSVKLPATHVLGHLLKGVPEVEPDGWSNIQHEVKNGVAYLRFPFYNGAMSTVDCKRLEAAYRASAGSGVRVMVLMGGSDFWSNGLNLNTIEAAESPADEAWNNINAMNDLCHAILTDTGRLTIAAMRGNAGAGGVFLALAADRVLARSGAVLNPHYKNMGNLYGSEYWTYLLPQRVTEDGIDEVKGRRLPLGASRAVELGLIDGIFSNLCEVEALAEGLAASPELDEILKDKHRRRMADEAKKPLESYRAEELERMRLNFYGFDPSYHVARYNFVHRVPHSRTPLFLASHRRLR